MKTKLLAVGLLAALPSINSSFSKTDRNDRNVKIVESSLQKLFDDCNADLFGYEDYAVCPTAEKYVFEKFSMELVKKYFDSYNLKKSSASDAASLITNSMRDQANPIVENSYNPDDEDGLAAKEAHKDFLMHADRIERILKRLPKSNQIFTDPDTYWAPSVNARAMLIVNAKKKSVTVILHGDTDG